VIGVTGSGAVKVGWSLTTGAAAGAVGSGGKLGVSGVPPVGGSIGGVGAEGSIYASSISIFRYLQQLF